MTPIDFKDFYLRELDNLHKDISAFTDENKLWVISGEIKNSPGNLCLHLLGNVNHFIGAMIGKNGYVLHIGETVPYRFLEPIHSQSNQPYRKGA